MNRLAGRVCLVTGLDRDRRRVGRALRRRRRLGLRHLEDRGPLPRARRSDRGRRGRGRLRRRPTSPTKARSAAAVEACVDRFGRIDGLFSVAGGSGRRFGDGPIHEVTGDAWDATLA